ncbi:alpha-L-fucosidase [Arenibacter sp. F20364]|uniref:alpha-L-fucosidase n=1 Tax=Arenibacter sp. F20364 TaxID=2926415 RepID=UPI001FF5E6B6|nr:alpha-L-fucosidase [Arenibacter sp. F20364]MCK0191715.1 alpha-L-fucosidase [Arenibacter sp. F20364]
MANAQNKIDPYAETGDHVIGDGIVTVEINPNQINVLTARYASISPNLKPVVKNHMFLWVESITPELHYLEWKVKSPKTDVYEVSTLVFAEEASIELSCNGQKEEVVNKALEWSRLSLGSVRLNEGDNLIKMMVRTSNTFNLSSIELTQPKIRQKINEDTFVGRQYPDWFRDAGYGLMFQWTNRATPEKGDTIKNWEDKVNDFDVERFANMVEQTGASYVLWSITWGQQYISAPLKSLDKLIKGRTTKRDLLGEMADVLDKKGIKLIFYYHYGYDCYHSVDSDWMEASGGYKADKTELYYNITNILSEIGKRYKRKLHGWWFDGAQRYYDCHFDGSSGGILSAPFEEMTQAARRGNIERIVSYNSWMLPSLTEYQDYFAGEGLKQFEGLKDGKFQEGPQKGLMAHTCFPLERRWGHIDQNSKIVSPHFSAEILISRIKHAQEHRYPLSINLEMYEDGSVSPESLELLKTIQKTMSTNESKISPGPSPNEQSDNEGAK